VKSGNKPSASIESLAAPSLDSGYQYTALSKLRPGSGILQPITMKTNSNAIAIAARRSGKNAVKVDLLASAIQPHHWLKPVYFKTCDRRRATGSVWPIRRSDY
jgi:hypothetical protein